MPTGYTAPVESGEITTLPQYALLCARAFGATIMMRDDPLDAPIPERFEPETSHYDEKIEQARERLRVAQAMTQADAATAANEAFRSAMESHESYEARRKTENDRFRAMADKVEAWDVPEDLAELRKFMLQQLDASIFEYKHEPPTCLTWSEFKESEVKAAEADVVRYTKHRDDEIERANGRNHWIAELRRSLEGVE
jgi:hypothetical protein